MFEAFLSNRTVSVLAEALPRILTAGLTMTIPLTLVSFFFAMIIAVAVALVQYANVPVLRQIARFYIWVIRGTPLLVQLFIIFYGLPSVGIMLDAFPAAVIAFAFNEGAYCAETMRGALESVPQGQLEAGYCVGMSWWQIDQLCPRRYLYRSRFSDGVRYCLPSADHFHPAGGGGNGTAGHRSGKDCLQAPAHCTAHVGNDRS